MSRCRSLAPALALAAGLLAAAPAPAGGLPPGLSFGGPFALEDGHGRTRTDAEFRGRFLLVLFGYTGCPDICPLDLSIIAEALDRLGPEGERVQPLFVTVDPARDTPAVLAAYVAHFHPRLLGLGGSEAAVRDAARAYRVHRRKVVTDPARPGDYLVDHGSLTYLMGPDGGFRTLLPHGTEPARMAEVVRSYLAAEPAPGGS